MDKSSLPQPQTNWDTMQDNGKAAAWESIWDWCYANGLAEHSINTQDAYDELNGPQTVCQWINDLKEQRDAWRAACRRLYDAVNEGGSQGRPIDIIPRDDWRQIAYLIGQADELEQKYDKSL